MGIYHSKAAVIEQTCDTNTLENDDTNALDDTTLIGSVFARTKLSKNAK